MRTSVAKWSKSARQALEQLVNRRSGDRADGICDDCSGQQTQHIAQPVEAETRAEIALDQPCGK